MKYEIIASGSKGNSVRIEDMLIDVGVPFAQLKEHLYEVKYIIITHRHCDHLNSRTVESIKRHFPRIQWIGNWDVCSLINLDHIVGDNTLITLKDRTIEAFPCVHDVPTTGYVITMNDKTCIYATDTSSLEHAPNRKYDILFLESNHDEKKVDAVIHTSKKLYGYDAYAGAKRHLSTQQSKAFYYLNRKNKESEWVELHKSERFY